jgi:hypothetical protein
MPANLNGAEHYHTVRIREVPSSNLGRHTTRLAFWVSCVILNRLGIRGLETIGLKAFIREVLSLPDLVAIIDLMACP